MTQQEASVPRFFIGLSALGILAVQLVILPRTAAGYAREYPEVAYLEPLYVTALVIALIGLEVALLAAWQLVSATRVDKASGSRPGLWSNVVAASLSFMAVIFAGVCLHAGWMVGIGGPAVLFGIVGSIAVVVSAFALRRWVKSWFTHENSYALSAI